MGENSERSISYIPEDGVEKVPVNEQVTGSDQLKVSLDSLSSVKLLDLPFSLQIMAKMSTTGADYNTGR